ncbi:uncharacterized protein [Palaemon carinicauda]|uniref:uncharacterized protein isoform X2 n=1 Tax=Palaemon carinicauda TaxID=392227 RepID=UPI0035B5FA86
MHQESTNAKKNIPIAIGRESHGTSMDKHIPTQYDEAEDQIRRSLRSHSISNESEASDNDLDMYEFITDFQGQHQSSPAPQDGVDQQEEEEIVQENIEDSHFETAPEFDEDVFDGDENLEENEKAPGGSP